MYNQVEAKPGRRMPWEPGGSRLWSLWDMQIFSVGELLLLLTGAKAAISTLDRLHFYSEITDHLDPDHPSLKDSAIKSISRNVQHILSQSEQMNIPEISQWCRIVIELNNSDSGHLQFHALSDAFTSLEQIIITILIPRRFYYMEPKEVYYYDITVDDYFGPEITRRFNEAKYDLLHALRCHAFSMSTACVMHLQRALEVGVRGLWRSLYHPNTTIKDKGGFGKYIGDIRSFIKLNHGLARFPDWSVREPFYNESEMYIAGLKTVRNGTVHIERKYDTIEAECQLTACRTLMKHMASHINQRGVYR